MRVVVGLRMPVVARAVPSAGAPARPAAGNENVAGFTMRAVAGAFTAMREVGVSSAAKKTKSSSPIRMTSPWRSGCSLIALPLTNVPIPPERFRAR